MPRRLFISGLTAAGKTTHAKMLASAFALQYVSASSFLLQQVDIDPEMLPNNFWISPLASQLRERRAADQSIDEWVDQHMITAASELDHVVFDAWGLPWLSAAPGLRIWLDSSTRARWWKALISQGAASSTSADQILEEITEKDTFTRNYFLARYGFDIFRDHQVFDYCLDITEFITAPTYEASLQSIAASHEIVAAVVHYYFLPEAVHEATLVHLLRKYSRAVFGKVPGDLEQFL
jgi:cytidylate kinase